MESDFHYYAVAALARAAGYPPGDALTIATASQYVDDATESAPIRVGDFLFEPVRTAHEGLKVYSWEVQKQVYMPFHFLPARPFDPAEAPDPSFETLADSPFANAVLAEALAEPAGTFRLCRIGIALHAFADSFSHQGFSGKNDPLNDVTAIRLRRGGKWETPFWPNLGFDFMPRVGHSQASLYPDLAGLTWSFKRARGRGRSRALRRDNGLIFEKAAERIYEILAGGPHPGASVPRLPWEEFAEPLRRLLRSGAEREAGWAGWKAQFGPLFEGLEYHYDRMRWRVEALGDARKVHWDHTRRASFRRMWFRLEAGFYESPWVQFHRAARKQSHFVLERLV